MNKRISCAGQPAPPPPPAHSIHTRLSPRIHRHDTPLITPPLLYSHPTISSYSQVRHTLHPAPSPLYSLETHNTRIPTTELSYESTLDIPTELSLFTPTISFSQEQHPLYLPPPPSIHTRPFFFTGHPLYPPSPFYLHPTILCSQVQQAKLGELADKQAQMRDAMLNDVMGAVQVRRSIDAHEQALVSQ